jgi:hypothetical protein
MHRTTRAQSQAQPPVPAVPTSLRPGANGRQVGAFLPGGHTVASPEVGSAGTSAAVALANLHSSMSPTPARVEPLPPTLDAVNLARRHVADSKCGRCGAWLAGVQAGTAGQKAVHAAEIAQAEAQAAQDAEDLDMARRAPERFIAVSMRRQALAAYRARRPRRPQRPR